MAELYWAWTPYQLSDAAEDIGDVYEGLQQAMEQHGWTDVQIAEDIHGYKPGIDLFAAVVFLFCGGRTFWQVISVGGDATSSQASQEIQQLESLINGLEFL